MKCRFGDERLYDFHDSDVPERCFFCKTAVDECFIVREIQARKMIHVCADCLITRCSEYLLDNTRPWEEQK